MEGTSSLADCRPHCPRFDVFFMPLSDMTVDTPAGQLPARPRAYRPTLATYHPQGPAACSLAATVRGRRTLINAVLSP